MSLKTVVKYGALIGLAVAYGFVIGYTAGGEL